MSDSEQDKGVSAESNLKREHEKKDVSQQVKQEKSSSDLQASNSHSTSSSSSTSSASAPSSHEIKKKQKRNRKKQLKKEKKLKQDLKNKMKKLKAKLKKKEKKARYNKLKQMEKAAEDTKGDTVGPVPLSNAQEVPERSRLMAPMTKEEWEKRQSTVRRVYDEATGRHRLIKGDGEVIEEIVSKERHHEINRQATMGDGASFQTELSVKLGQSFSNKTPR